MIIIRPTLTPITPLGMESSSSTSISSSSTSKIVNMVPKSGTPAGNVASNDLVVNGAGNVTVSASCTVSSTSSFTLHIYLNGVKASSTSGSTSATWTGDVVAGDLISIWGQNAFPVGTKTVNSAEVEYTVNSS